MFYKIAGLSRKAKIFLMLLCDVFLLPLAFYSAIALRLGTFQTNASNFYWILLAVPVITVPIFIRIGLYRAVIRYMDDKIIATVFFGVTLSVVLLTAVLGFFRFEGVPRSSVLIYWFISVAYICSSRFVARGLLHSLERRTDRRIPVAIYGAGRSGLQTALALMSGPEFKPVAFFDDDKDVQGTNVAGIRVFNPRRAFEIMGEKNCRQLLIAMPSAPRSRRKEIIQAFEGKELILKTLPGLGELVDGRVRIEDIRDVGVEDLLGRDAVPPFQHLVSSCIENRVVLVTGAGGSIGSELCRQIVHNKPKQLVLFELSEYALYKIESDLRRLAPNVNMVAVLGDVADKARMKSLFSTHAVQTVYHAAAYKHVPLVEANIIAGFSNNVFGTWSCAEAAVESNVGHFVLVSTDKAVRPTNVMGATKRLAEMVLQAMAVDKQNVTKFIMVRFGNVLGSSGSVVPLFKEQIRSGGPVTVTHPDVTRYFMTIPEAAQLVLQAGAMGHGGDVFVLDMGEPVKILDLAKKVIELSGLEVFDSLSGKGDIPIEFVGLRPGEKLFEELLIGDRVELTEHPRIMRAEEKMLAPDVLFKELNLVKNLCLEDEEGKVLEKLKVLVPEFKAQSLI